MGGMYHHSDNIYDFITTTNLISIVLGLIIKISPELVDKIGK